VTKHRVLIVGVGSIGERHLRCFLSTGRATASFVEVHPELRTTIAERYGVRGFAALDEALAEPHDLAVVCTPAPLHVSQAQQLVERGLHVLIEKPLSTVAAGLERLQQTVRERGVTVGVAYVYRCHPVLTALRQVLCDGRFGRPVELVAVTGQHFPTYRPAYRTIYYNNRQAGGGAIQDALTHILNAGEWLVGPITRLVADAAHQVLDGVDVEDTVHLLARHGDVLASYSLNQHQAPNELTITVICERGTVRFEGHHQRWRWMADPSGEWHDEVFPTMERDALFVAQANRFLDAIEGHEPVACSFAEGWQTLKVNLAALASADGAGWQSIS
jgi:predicted dehydrogenase